MSRPLAGLDPTSHEMAPAIKLGMKNDLEAGQYPLQGNQRPLFCDTGRLRDVALGDAPQEVDATGIVLIAGTLWGALTGVILPSLLVRKWVPRGDSQTIPTKPSAFSVPSFLLQRIFQNFTITHLC